MCSLVNAGVYLCGSVCALSPGSLQLIMEAEAEAESIRVSPAAAPTHICITPTTELK